MKTKTKTGKEVYIWYDPDHDKCVSGTMTEYEHSRAISLKHDDFNMICMVGNDQTAVEDLVRQFRVG